MSDQEQEQPKKDLKEMYIENLKISVDEKGIHPYPGMAIKKDGNMNIYAFMLNPNELIASALKIANDREIIEFATGLDRFRNKEDHGRDGVDEKYDSIFTCIYFERETMAVDYFYVPYVGMEIGPANHDPEAWWNKLFENEIMKAVEGTLPQWMKDMKNRKS